MILISSLLFVTGCGREPKQVEPLSLDEVFEVLKEMGEYSSDEEKPVVMD